MNPLTRTASTFALVAGEVLLAGFVVVGGAVAGFGPGLLGGMLYLFLNGWAVFVFLRHRAADQYELLTVLTATAEARLPLASGVAAYADSRRRFGDMAAVVRWVALVALPLYGYARVWLGWRTYDRLVDDLADRLEDGEALSDALRGVPGVAAREVRLAAAVGERTGNLGLCLRTADGERWASAWAEVAPRMIYPLVVLVFVTSMLGFLMTVVIPKYKKIYDEFGLQLPEVTRALIDFSEVAVRLAPLTVPAVLLAIGVASFVLATPTLRWYVPLAGALYRWGAQAEVLRSLGRLLAVGQTTPAALAFMAGSEDLPEVVLRRVRRAHAAVERGDPLADALRGAGLLPRSMSLLVHASERTRTLPQTLLELGHHLGGRAHRLVHRLVQLLTPLMVLMVGTVVAFIAVGMFVPLVRLIMGLAE